MARTFDANHLTIAATNSPLGLTYREAMLDAYDRAVVAHRHNPTKETKARRAEIKSDLDCVYAQLNAAINRATQRRVPEWLTDAPLNEWSIRNQKRRDFVVRASDAAS